MKRFGLIFALYAALCASANAQIALPFPGPGMPSAAAPTYQGPGDVVSGAIGWFGLRAYSVADRGNNLINACNINDATCVDIASNASTGKLTSTPVIGGQTCEYTISSGTYNSATGAVSLTMSASTPLGSTLLFGIGLVTGTGNASQIIGPFGATSGTSGTTVNFTAVTGLGTIAITGGTVSICSIKTFYDRSAALSCAGSACDITQATAGQRGFLFQSCLNSLPCAVTGGSNLVYQSAATIASQSATSHSVSAVVSRATSFTTTNGIFATGVSGLNELEAIFRVIANAVQMFAGTSGVFTSNITDSNFHALQFSFNGASSELMCGGSAGTSCSTAGTDNSLSPGTTASSASGRFYFAYDGTTGHGLQGYITEAGAWPVTFTGTQRTNMNANQYTYWGPF